MKLDEAQELIVEEYIKASNKFSAMRSPHEGYAIILEELDELWEIVKKEQKQPFPSLRGKMEDEAKQVAAMAIRFMVDCC